MVKNILLVKGPTGSGKTKKLIGIYQTLLNEGKRSDSILVLVRNRRQSIIWRDIIDIRKASSIKIQSYFGFIQGEIKRYWPLINTHIEGFKNGILEPVFLTTEISQFILNRFVDEFRGNGRFADTTATSEKITIEVLSILSRSTASNLDMNSIGKRLFDANPNKDASRQRLFSDIQEVINKYIEFCNESGYIDYSMAIKFYDNYLFTSKSYLKQMNQEIRHIIVDGIEEAVPCEADFVSYMINACVTGVLSFSTDGSISRKQGACPEYVEKMIFPKCSEIIELDTSHTCNPEFFSFAQEVYQSITNRDGYPAYSGGILSEKNLSYVRTIQTELRSEMLSMACVEIEKYIKKGFKPSDVVVICPIVDTIAEYCIESWFAKQGISTVNLARTRSYIEDSFIRALVTLACLSHPQWNINPPGHDISNLLSMVLKLDPVRSALLAREVMAQKPFTLPEIASLEFRDRIGFVNTERYYYLKSWIENFRKENHEEIELFFQKALHAILLNVPMIQQHINSCRILIESAEIFTRTIKPMTGNETGKAFIELLKKGVKPAETISELEQKLNTEAIIISTPNAYISSSIKRKIQIWLDVSSQLWCKSDVEQISNPYVFSPEWQEGDVWTDELNERFRLLKCATYSKRLIRMCPGEIVFAESQYNQDGYENEGVTL